jgi:hypothetical protein
MHLSTVRSAHGYETVQQFSILKYHPFFAVSEGEQLQL